MTEIWIERRKWPDKPHYAHSGWILGEDDHGLWIELRVGSPIYRGDDIAFHGTGGGLMLAPAHQGWLAWFPEFGDFELYVDIIDGVTRSDSGITMVDLDLDLIRRRNGEVELLDEDEFALHQIEFGYSADMIEHAEYEAARVLRDVKAGVEPFGGRTATAWMARRNGSQD